MREKKPSHSAESRRQHIRSQLQSPGSKVSFLDIQRQFHVKEQSLYADAKHFRDNGIPIAVKDRSFEYSEDQLTVVGTRKTQARKAKKEIGELAAQLIVGPELRESEVPPHDFLGQQPFTPRISSLFTGLWNKAHRHVIIDSGTTTEAVARCLRDVRCPSPRHRLANLRILTNGKTILDTLDQASCGHSIILVGGAYRRSTGAVAGLLGANCLDAWRMGRADVAMIGTTNLNQEYEFCCDSEDESDIKSRLLDAALVRCVVAHSEKLIGGGTRGSVFPFASLTSAAVDVIVTDSSVHSMRTNAIEESGRLRFLDRVLSAGVCLIANPKSHTTEVATVEPSRSKRRRHS